MAGIAELLGRRARGLPSAAHEADDDPVEVIEELRLRGRPWHHRARLACRAKARGARREIVDRLRAASGLGLDAHPGEPQRRGELIELAG